LLVVTTSGRLVTDAVSGPEATEVAMAEDGRPLCSACQVEPVRRKR